MDPIAALQNPLICMNYSSPQELSHQMGMGMSSSLALYTSFKDFDRVLGARMH